MWRDATKERPENAQFVFVCFVNPIDPEDMFYCQDTYYENIDKQKWVWYTGRGEFPAKYWMPIPALPKGGD